MAVESVADQQKSLVVIDMGSEGDTQHVGQITKYLDVLQVPYEQVVASAHKTPELVLAITKVYNARPHIVYITVAGLSDALSGFCAATGPKPVIACPPPDNLFGILAWISSGNVPSGLHPTLAFRPEQAAIAAASIMGLNDPDIAQSILDRQRENRMRIYTSEINSGNPSIAHLLGEFRLREGDVGY